MKVCPDVDVIIYNGKQIAPVGTHSDRTYILLNKPVGYVTTMKDEKGRLSVADLLSDVGVRVYPVGRLDMYSDGLLLCTNDGDLANRLMHPAHDVPKEYRLVLRGTLTEEDALRFTLPMTLDGYMLRPVETKLLSSGDRLPDGQICSTLSVILHEGRNRQIRRMSEQLGYTVIRLTRIRIGSFILDGLKSGKWRHLSNDEIQYLKNI
jgi:23S rRNA pseudouridine2605 synthase